MNGTRSIRTICTWLVAGLAAAGCGGGAGSGGGGSAGDAAGLGVELVYTEAGSPRATGIARALAAAHPDRARTSVADRPDGTWLRLTVEGPDFAPIVCEFPRSSGGRCDGIPAGSGRTVNVEEWDAAFETLYFRGRAVGVRVEAGRDTRVTVQMRPPVAIRYPAPDAALNLSTFEARVQTEPAALVDLYLDAHLIGTARSDSSGIARIAVANPPTPTSAAAPLSDGEYLLSAVAFPALAPGSPPVRHLSAPLLFAVDLTPPTLQLSGPSVSNSLVVDLAGVTEPGVSVRCGEDRPSISLQPPVSDDGRFRVESFPIGDQATTIACDATDAAGNVTERRFVVTYLPSSFPLEADMVDVTNRPTAGVVVRSHPNITGIEVAITGEKTGVTRRVPLARQAEPSTFAGEVTLDPNQWNHVRISATIGAQEVGVQTVLIEHDDIEPIAPSTVGMTPTPLRAEVIGNRLYYDDVRIEFEPKDPATRLEVYEWAEQTMCCDTGPDGSVIPKPPQTPVTVTNGAEGYFSLPPGKCYWALGGRAIDRAGNVSSSWGILLSPPMGGLITCTR